LGKLLLEERARSEEIYSAKLQSWLELLYASLEKLIELDIQLNELQPIHSGRLRIQWFAYRPKEWQFKGERYPLFVQWQKNFAIELWRAKRVPIASILRYQHKTKAFKPHVKEVKTLLTQMRELVLIYRQARKTLRLLKEPSLQRINKNTQLLEPSLIQPLPNRPVAQSDGWSLGFKNESA